MITEITTRFLTKITCDLHEIKDIAEAPENAAEVARQLKNLATNIGHFKRAKEALGAGSLHGEETLANSRDEVSAIYGADTLRFGIIIEKLK